jgi:hypothetical protein
MDNFNPVDIFSPLIHAWALLDIEASQTYAISMQSSINEPRSTGTACDLPLPRGAAGGLTQTSAISFDPFFMLPRLTPDHSRRRFLFAVTPRLSLAEWHMLVLGETHSNMELDRVGYTYQLLRLLASMSNLSVNRFILPTSLSESCSAFTDTRAT